MVAHGYQTRATSLSLALVFKVKKRKPPIFTSCKRSLGQGNVFTPVCHSVHREALCPGGLCPGVSVQGGSRSVRGDTPDRDPPVRSRAGGTHPTGIHSCFLRLCPKSRHMEKLKTIRCVDVFNYLTRTSYFIERKSIKT